MGIRIGIAIDRAKAKAKTKTIPNRTATDRGASLLVRRLRINAIVQ